MNRVLTDFNQTELFEEGEQSSATWYLYGSDLANLGRYTEALECFDHAIALQPDNVAAWVFRAVMLIHLEQYPDALESCDRAIEICPYHSEAWTFRGVALHRLGRYPEAYACYDRAVGQQHNALTARLKHWLKRRFESLRQALT